MNTGDIISVKNAEHYEWDKNCHGWHLLKDSNLGVIEELMGPGTAEKFHYHKNARQLFYILSGKAGFELGQQTLYAGPGESIHVLPGLPHRIFNNGEGDLRFIVISSPHSHGDRIVVDEGAH